MLATTLHKNLKSGRTGRMRKLPQQLQSATVHERESAPTNKVYYNKMYLMSKFCTPSENIQLCPIYTYLYVYIVYIKYK